MSLHVRNVGLCMSCREVYDKKVADGYTYKSIEAGKLFNSLYRLSKDKTDFVIGGNSNHIISMYAFSDTIRTIDINKKYIEYLEHFFSHGFNPIPDSLKRQLQVVDKGSENPITFLNGSSIGDELFLIGYSADPKNSNNSIWMTIAISTGLMGLSKPRRKSYQRSSGESNDIDVWDIIGGVTTIAGLSGMFF